MSILFTNSFRIIVVLSQLWLGNSIALAAPLNAPYGSEQIKSDTLFTSFSSPAKHLDPVISYSSNEWAIISQIYEPPLQYHYFKQPFELEPLTLLSMPEVRYFNREKQPVSESEAAFTEYTFTLKPNILFHTHPGFARNQVGDFLYHQLTAENVVDLKSLADFAQSGQRELLAEDYVYAIKRMALRQNHSPILDSMLPLIVGLSDYSKKVTTAYKGLLATSSESNAKNTYYNLNQFQISGVQVVDKYRFKILVNGKYPQFLYWLTMNFFAPIPWEVDAFYKQQLLVEKNISLDTAPIGTGPYELVENNPNKRMRLVANANYRLATFPNSGLPATADKSLLADAGLKLPFVKEVVYSLEKESVPLWNKFLQGFYDASGVSSDSFDQAINVSNSGNLSLTKEMAEKGIQFVNAIQPTIMYMGFNMVDPIVGGYDERSRKLRQAISIAINMEEYISIFLNGRGESAHGPIPPGIFGYRDDEAGYNKSVYQWLDGRVQRKGIEFAKQLLAEAGFPNGRDKEGNPLTLYYDTPATGPDSQSMLNWYRKQFAKLGIELIIRATDYNRFQDKVRGAKVQLFSWGWNADYPDPENFLFLLYGKNAAIHTNGAGINSANYDNTTFNRLFEQMKSMENSDKRQRIIDEMIQLVQKDSPWVWGYHPKSLALYHSWLKNIWPNPLVNNSMKYRRIDADERVEKQAEWNKAAVWPIVLVVLFLVALSYPLWLAYRQRQSRKIVVDSMRYFDERGY